jgi:hypothetical protein
MWNTQTVDQQTCIWHYVSPSGLQTPTCLYRHVPVSVSHVGQGSTSGSYVTGTVDSHRQPPYSTTWYSQKFSSQQPLSGNRASVAIRLTWVLSTTTSLPIQHPPGSSWYPLPCDYPYWLVCNNTLLCQAGTSLVLVGSLLYSQYPLPSHSRLRVLPSMNTRFCSYPRLICFTLTLIPDLSA